MDIKNEVRATKIRFQAKGRTYSRLETLQWESRDGEWKLDPSPEPGYCTIDLLIHGYARELGVSSFTMAAEVYEATSKKWLPLSYNFQR